MTDSQALSGVRILDFTQVLAGPFATQQLAQLGADVIKVEQREVGDITRGLLSSGADGMAPSFLSCNLGKRSLTLDLKHERATAIVHKLVETSDAVVENFKPGTIDRLGYGYDALKAIKPDLVYASISGYGQTGPKAELPAFDGAIQAASGMMSISGHPDTGPVRTGYFSVDMSTALNAAFAITAALLRRFRTGEGQHLDIAMMDTAMVMQAAQASTYMSNGTLPELMGNRSPTRQPTANVFATSDGYVQIVGLRESHAEALFKLIGREDLYATYPEPRDRINAGAEIDAVLALAIAEKTSAHWLQALHAAGVPAAPIQDLAQATAEEQFNHRLIFADTNGADDRAKRVVSAGHVATPDAPQVQRPAPALGEHTEALLSELGYTSEQISELCADNVV